MAWGGGVGTRRPAPREPSRRRRSADCGDRLGWTERRRCGVRPATGLERFPRRESRALPRRAQRRRGVVAAGAWLGALPGGDGASVLLAHQPGHGSPGVARADAGPRGSLVLIARRAGELLGFPATNKEVETDGIASHRIRDGKIVEYWSVTDVARVLQPVGAL